MQKIIKEIRDAIIIVNSLSDEGYVVRYNGKYAVSYDGDDGYSFFDYPLDVFDFEEAQQIADELICKKSIVSIDSVSEYKYEALDSLNRALGCFILNDYADEC